MNYKLVNNSFTGKLQNIKRTDVSPPIFIPINEANTDYQEYLAWVAEGNTPDPAD